MERLNLIEIYDGAIHSEGRGFGSKESISLIAPLSGALLTTVGDQLFALHPGEALLIPPHTFFAVLEPKKEAAFLSLSFEAENFSLEEASLRPLGKELPESLARSLEEEERYPLLTLLLLGFLKTAPLSPFKKSGDAILFFEAAERLEKDLLNAPSAEALAEEMGLSLSKLKRLFARFAGMGAHEYLTDRRIALAKQYLKEGRSVTETADLCGFANQAYFSAAFKKNVGRSPKEYLAKPIAEKTVKPPKPRAKKAEKPQKKSDMPSYLL